MEVVASRWTEGGPIDARYGWAITSAAVIGALFVGWFAWTTSSGLESRDRVEGLYVQGWGDGCEDIFQGRTLFSDNGTRYTPDWCYRLITEEGTPVPRIRDSSDLIIRLQASIDATNAVFDAIGDSDLCTKDGKECISQETVSLDAGVIYPLQSTS